MCVWVVAPEGESEDGYWGDQAMNGSDIAIFVPVTSNGFSEKRSPCILSFFGASFIVQLPRKSRVAFHRGTVVHIRWNERAPLLHNQVAHSRERLFKCALQLLPYAHFFRSIN